jgi:hypothetical protein
MRKLRCLLSLVVEYTGNLASTKLVPVKLVDSEGRRSITEMDPGL